MTTEGFMNEAEIWILHDKRQVLLTDIPGPVLGATFFGRYELPEMGWGRAREIAEAEAKRLGYELEYEIFA